MAIFHDVRIIFFNIKKRPYRIYNVALQFICEFIAAINEAAAFLLSKI